MRPARVAVLIFCGALAACASKSREVRPDEMSAEAHRREAAAERRRSDAEMALYDPGRPIPPGSPSSSDRLYPELIYAPTNPTSHHLYEAQRHSDHARAHEAAAAELEKFEETDCRDFPPKTRAACPVLGAMRAEDLPNGVRLHLGPAMPVDATLAHMRCHMAWARTRGFAPTATCPLYLRGTEIRRSGDAIDLVSDDPIVAKRLQQLARGEE
jgi:hypothetical protein